VGALYSREHFANVRASLAPEVFSAYGFRCISSRGRPADIVRTFLAVFPEASGWHRNFGSMTPVLALVGSDRPAACSSARGHSGTPATAPTPCARSRAWGFRQLNLNRVSRRVFEDNAGARRCYEKVGFREEGRLRRTGSRTDAISTRW
jgi:hypothetical protein